MPFFTIILIEGMNSFLDNDAIISSSAIENELALIRANNFVQ